MSIQNATSALQDYGGFEEPQCSTRSCISILEKFVLPNTIEVMYKGYNTWRRNTPWSATRPQTTRRPNIRSCRKRDINMKSNQQHWKRQILEAQIPCKVWWPLTTTLLTQNDTYSISCIHISVHIVNGLRNEKIRNHTVFDGSFYIIPNANSIAQERTQCKHAELRINVYLITIRCAIHVHLYIGHHISHLHLQYTVCKCYKRLLIMCKIAMIYNRQSLKSHMLLYSYS